MVFDCPVGHKVDGQLNLKVSLAVNSTASSRRLRCVSLAPTRRVGHFAISKLDLAPLRGLDKLTLHEEPSFRLLKLVGDLCGSPIKGERFAPVHSRAHRALRLLDRFVSLAH